MEGKIRQRITFSGYVQGVGFRYRAQYAAKSCGVTGWVSNEWDGTVQMEAQGTRREIDEMLKLIRQGQYIEISHMTCEDIPLEEYERSFHIR